MSFFGELRRRNVVRVGLAYAVIGWIVAQVSEFFFDGFGAPAWVLQVLIVLLILGLPVVLVFAWAFELTPEGVKRERDVDRSLSITRTTGRKLNVVIVGGLAIAVIVLLAERTLHRDTGTAVASSAQTAAEAAPGTRQPEKSIAVLPFVAMTSSQDDEFFADGLSEELLNVLAQVDGLKVAGRTSSFYYKGRNEDLRTIATSLGVANVLEGSVRRSGDTLRVTAQLIEADTGFHLWSDTFDRPQGDIFRIQDEIARHVATALQAKILGGASPAAATEPANPEAQNQYLIAQAAVADRTLPGVRRARDLYAKAAVLDPDNPRYLAGFAMAVALQYWNFRDISPDEAIYESSTAIDRALSLGEPSADTLAVAGLVEELKAMTASDPNAKERALGFYEKAIERDPQNILALQWLASIYLDINRNTEARDYFERVVELDPLNTLALTGLANAYASLGQYQAAREHLYKVQSLFPELGMAYRYLAGIEFSSGHMDRATIWMRKAVDADPNALETYMLLNGYVILGWTDEALAVAEQFRETSDGLDISRLTQAWLDVDHAAIVEEAMRLFARTGESEYAILSAWSNALTDNCAASIPILERQYPSLQGEVINYIESKDVIDAVLLAHCYRQNGDAAGSGRLAAALLASENLSDAALTSWPALRLTRVAALAVAGRGDEALALLGSLDYDELPVVISEIPLAASQLPVFDNIRGEQVFEQYMTRERYRLAQQAKDLASGQALDALVAEVRAAGHILKP